MKRVAMSIALVLGACGAEEAPETEIAAAGGSATAEVELPAMEGPPPEHGGTVVMAGERPIEVVADEAGEIKAFFLGEAPTAPQDARITVRVPDREGQVRPVVLTWDPAASRYQGMLRGAQPAPGPIELVLVLGSETLRGRAPTYVIEAAQAVQAAVPVEAAGGLVRAAAPGTAVVVEPPQPPDVVVQAPAAPPPPTIVVQQPAPPSARVVVAAPPVPPPPGVVVTAPPSPNARVVVAAPPPQPNARVVVAAPPAPPPPNARVVVAAPPAPRVVAAQPPPANARVVAQPPPANARVVAAQPPPASARVVAQPPAARVVASPPPAPAVQARPPRPSPPGRAVGHDREDDDRGRGRGRGRGDD